MTVTATKVGRDLHLTVEGAGDPFVIRPLPGWAGRDLTERYLALAAGHADASDMEELLQHAADGVTPDGEWITGGPVYTAIDNRLSLDEAHDVLVPALLWQTVLGMKGVNTFLAQGGGDAGAVKALWSLVSTLGGSSSLTSPASALETLIRTLAPTPPTSTPQGGVKPGKQPQDRLHPRQNRQG